MPIKLKTTGGNISLATSGLSQSQVNSLLADQAARLEVEHTEEINSIEAEHVEQIEEINEIHEAEVDGLNITINGLNTEINELNNEIDRLENIIETDVSMPVEGVEF